ncbi:transporter, major facilitator subfamily protein [Acanthamoeba castellanii str. Neff]|uniref:Transporter, major facilitator subfamily protein n=1 Tax=Acanthamoeba castellanii (strain ATCC 30010 / Neff) TaxID=1257118 RepID=L8GYV9_ACACF|nr:transporter, major facilitator subfamily protein [Acanthamoeba castellanii str. Neff]ELR18160.1 transporter, major facilitator subfamily protein [Acanthamoeba castellanii str. Neff]
MASKKDTNFLLYSLGSDDDDDAGDDMVYSSLLASSDSNAFVSDDEAVDTHHQHKAVHEVPHDDAPVPQWRMATLALWQFGYAAMMAFIMAILLPLQTLEMVGKENKGTALGVSVAVATVIATVISLAFGQASDHISTPIGKRTPFVVVSSAGLALLAVAMTWYGAAGLTGAGVYVVYAGLLLALRTCAGVAETAFQPLLPDLVPKHQMGTVSGWWAMGQMVGNLFGLAGGSILMDQTGPVAVAIIISSLLTIALRFLARYIKPFLISSNFRWIFATRFVTQLGFGFVNNFVFYFIHDVSPLPYRLFGLEFTNTNDAVGIFAGAIMLTAVFSGYAGGALGDRLGRKRMVYVSSAFQTLACVGFVLLSVWPQQFTFLVISGVVMGIGLGSFLAVDFALATECLPSEESRGTDLAVWNLAMSLPIAFSGPLGGVMLDNGQRVGHALNLPNLGYVGLFASCGFLLALSAFFVRRITVGNPVRRRKPTNEIDLELVEVEDDGTFQ